MQSEQRLVYKGTRRELDQRPWVSRACYTPEPCRPRRGTEDRLGLYNLGYWDDGHRPIWRTSDLSRGIWFLATFSTEDAFGSSHLI